MKERIEAKNPKEVLQSLSPRDIEELERLISVLAQDGHPLIAVEIEGVRITREEIKRFAADSLFEGEE
jgi:hypothetical protein